MISIKMNSILHYTITLSTSLQCGYHSLRTGKSVFQITPVLILWAQVSSQWTAEKQGKRHICLLTCSWEFEKVNHIPNRAVSISRILKKWRWQKTLMNSLSRRTQPRTTLPLQAIATHPSSFRSWTRPLWVLIQMLTYI